MDVQKETRAQRFVDNYAKPMKGNALDNLTESAELSALRSRLNQVSQQSKSIPINLGHLLALAETIISILDKIISGIEAIKASQRRSL